MHWLKRLQYQKLEPVRRGFPHRDGRTSDRYPVAGQCDRCGVNAPHDLDGNVRPHRRKARIQIKHGYGRRAARRCAA